MTVQKAKRVTGDLLMTGKRTSSRVYSVYICDKDNAANTPDHMSEHDVRTW